MVIPCEATLFIIISFSITQINTFFIFYFPKFYHQFIIIRLHNNYIEANKIVNKIIIIIIIILIERII